jgi:DNA-binding NarL/FixJ family response regulator
VKTLSILLVDDSPVFLDSAELFLSLDKRLRIVGRASNGQEAIELAEHENPDLVMIDIAMPVMNGLEATRRLKSRPAAPQVFVVTGQIDSIYAEAARTAGADAFLGKPTLAEQLPLLLKPLLSKLE